MSCEAWSLVLGGYFLLGGGVNLIIISESRVGLETSSRPFFDNIISQI